MQEKTFLNVFELTVVVPDTQQYFEVVVHLNIFFLYTLLKEKWPVIAVIQRWTIAHDFMLKILCSQYCICKLYFIVVLCISQGEFLFLKMMLKSLFFSKREFVFAALSTDEKPCKNVWKTMQNQTSWPT